MKLNIINAIVIAGGIGLMLAGCTTSHSGMVLDRVGPNPAAPVQEAAATGSLMVYSAHEVNADFNRRDDSRPEYSDYRILNGEGTVLQRVHNNSGTILQRPRAVELPAGNYRVVAPANGYGVVTVPVTISAGQFTVLHLEGGFTWPDQTAFNQSNAVYLPDGEIVGWKSGVAMR
jgi:hypothetical protein